ncbi:MAG: serine/threonine protein kinase [Bradymonadaceae bacterium]|nr:serine/threonine protein kinase [Lujinxingiaceae bacterium]
MNVETLGKYTLVRHIATGGMAEIWLAEQKGPGGFNKELVIKRILPHLARDQHFTNMFLDEARLVAQLSHPHIGQIYELGELDGNYFIAMEFIDGLDLSKLLQLMHERGEQLPVELAVRIVCDVLAALDFAHEYTDRDGTAIGLVHRDISPQNVLVSNDGIVKLVDFGVAKAAVNQSKTEAGAVKGKFAYMAPEQIQNVQPLDRRVDVFAMGVLLYELLTGVKPFGDDLLAVSQILQSHAQDPRIHRADLPEPVLHAIQHALAKDRDERYASADAMLRDLENFLYQNNLVASARELSAFVRQLRGLPTPRATARAVPPTAALPGARKFDSGALPPTTTMPVPSIAVDDANGGGKMQPLMILGFFGILIAIVAAFLIIGYLVIGDTAPEPPVVTPPPITKTATPTKTVTTPTKTATAQPNALRHGDGLEVYLSTNIKAEVFYNGAKVGETPFQTNLRPGDYQLELKSGANRRTVPIKVEPGKLVQRYRFDL